MPIKIFEDGVQYVFYSFNNQEYPGDKNGCLIVFTILSQCTNNRMIKQ